MNTAEGEDMEGASQRFGQLLKQRRLAAGLTQEGLAERAGLSVPSISNLERGVAHTPRKETLGLLAAALELTPEEREEFLAAARGRPHAPAPIPALRTPLTPLLGRARELAALSALLHDTNTRLLTVTGAGGVGKTRLALDLALALARDAWDTFPDGLAQIELATVRDPTLVAAVIAGALNVREANQTLFADVLIQRLRDKKLLLLIDNFEHLLGAAPLISDLLATCPGLKILLTSRAPLRLRGEQEYPHSRCPPPPRRRPSPPWPTSLRYAFLSSAPARSTHTSPSTPPTLASSPPSVRDSMGCHSPSNWRRRAAGSFHPRRSSRSSMRRACPS
jgi:transcriptional regulator with XRE-family HTH domain